MGAGCGAAEGAGALSAAPPAGTSAAVGKTDLLSRWLAMARPLRHVPRAGAIALLLALFAGLVWSSVAVPRLNSVPKTVRVSPSGGPPIGDFALYALINRQVASGEDYYVAATEAQRQHNYATRPFVTVRLPTLAWINALLGPKTLHNLMYALLVLIAGLFFARIRPTLGLVPAVGGGLAVLLGGAGITTSQAASIHEMVAGLLIALAVVIYRPSRIWPSVIATGLALAVRELALPFVLLWLAFAMVERRWREAAVVAGMIALFFAGLVLHYFAVAALALPTDKASQGWNGLVGPAFPLLSLARFSGLTLVPLWLAGPVGALPLLGWLGMGGRTGLMAAMWSAGFFLAVALFARADNVYWVLMVLPLYLGGLAFVPRALGDLLASATGRGERLS